MKCKILLVAVIVLAGIPATALSEDISGVWKAEITGQDPKITRAIYEFKVDGDKLMGSVLGFQEDERPILDGKVRGDNIYFTLKEYVGNRTLEYRYEGKISGDTIKFKVIWMGAGNRYWKFNITKANP